MNVTQNESKWIFEEGKSCTTTQFFCARWPVDLCWEGKARWIQVGVVQSAQIARFGQIAPAPLFQPSLPPCHHLNGKCSWVHKKVTSSVLTSQLWMSQWTAWEFDDSNHVQAHWSLALAEALTSQTKDAPSIFKLCQKSAGNAEKIRTECMICIDSLIYKFQMSKSGKSKTWPGLGNPRPGPIKDMGLGGNKWLWSIDRAKDPQPTRKVSTCSWAKTDGQPA